MGNRSSAIRDCKRYRDGYPGLEDDTERTNNLLFYSNEIQSIPDGAHIEIIHKKWWGNYSLLERHHGYIQWLFPIREEGLNGAAQRLHLHEAHAIKNSKQLQQRIIRSYEMMLNFYGMKLVDMKLGTVSRHYNYKSRYAHLNSSYHNYLRITRILKCLGEMGLEHFKIHFVQHVLEEIYVHENLKNCEDSAKSYWIGVLRDEKDRKNLIHFVKKHDREYEFKEDVEDLSSDEKEKRRRKRKSEPKSESEEEVEEISEEEKPKTPSKKRTRQQLSQKQNKGKKKSELQAKKKRV